VILRYLKLEHYRSYERAELEFSPGLTAFVGPNGAGKSTLLEAFTWALFGKSRTEKEGIRSDFAPEKEPCRVEAAFEIQGVTYRAVRELRGRALTVQARLTREGSDDPLAEGAEAVAEQVQKLLGMDSTTFFASVFSRQKQVDALTEIRPGEREQAFRRMLGLDALDRALERIRADARDLENRLRGIREKRRDPAALKATRDGCRQNLEALRPELERARKAAEAAEAAEAAARREFDRLHALERRHAALDKEKGRIEEGLQKLARSEERIEADLQEARAAKERLGKMQPRIHELERVRERLRQLDPLREKHLRRESLGEEKKRLLESLAERRAELEGLQRRLEPLEETRRRAEELEQRFRQARKDLAEAQKEEARQESEERNLQKQMDELARKLALLRKLGPGGKCPTCLQTLGASYEEAVAHLEREHRNLEAALKEAREGARRRNRQVSAAEQELARLEESHRQEKKRLDELFRLEERREDRQREFRREEAELRKVERALAELADLEFDPREYERLRKQEAEGVDLEKDSARLEQVSGRIPGLERELREIRQERETILKKLQDVKEEISRLGFEPEQMEQTRRESDRARRARVRLQEERARLEQELVRRQKDLESAEREIAEEQRLQKLAEERERERAALALLQEIFTAFRQHLTDRIRPALAAQAGALLARITSGRYTQVELDDDYNVRVLDGGEMRPLRRFSGGETDLINLCLRIAISRVVAARGAGRVNLLVLDEVFGSQDARRKEDVLQALRSLTDEFQQVFVITHDESLRERMGNVVTVARPDGMPSTARAGG